MRKVIIFTVFLMAFAANAQQKRNIGNYSKLNVKGSFDITLVQGKTEATINASNKEILEHIKTEIKGDQLNIYIDGNGWKSSGDIKIELPYTTLNEISLGGSGSIVADGSVNSDDLKVSISGSGNIDLTVNSKNVAGSLTGSGDLTLSGKTTNFEGRLAGSGDLKAFELKAENTNIEVAGSGDADVYASENISAKIAGSGDIRYKGNPKQEDTKIVGSGAIEKA